MLETRVLVYDQAKPTLDQPAPRIKPRFMFLRPAAAFSSIYTKRGRAANFCGRAAPGGPQGSASEGLCSYQISTQTSPRKRGIQMGSHWEFRGISEPKRGIHDFGMSEPPCFHAPPNTGMVPEFLIIILKGGTGFVGVPASQRRRGF